MKKLALILFIVLFSTGSAFSMDTLDFSDFDSVDMIETHFSDLNRSVYASINTLTWSSADAPSVFGFNVGLVAGFGSFDANTELGIEDKGILPAFTALQAGFGTAGFEAYARALPEMELGSDIKARTLGFGLKYELSNLFPTRGFPDVSLFGEYNTYSLMQNRDIMTEFGTIDSGIDLDFESTNFGVLIGKSFPAVSVYGKAGYQSGTTDLAWNQALEGGITNRVEGNLSDSQFAYAVGLSFAGIKVEAGARGSNYAFGLGWGFGF
jgi:hypothetical protein